MSPGLALFLFGVSSLPAEGGDFTAPRVWVSMLVGVLLMAAFVWHSFRPEHPLLDLRLFRNRNLTVSIITMFLFAAAFFGGLLLVPTYFQQIRGESTLHAGLLVAPQGLGAMVTMPIAGTTGRQGAGGPDRARSGSALIVDRHVRPDPGHRDHAVLADHRDAGRDGLRDGRHDDAAVHHGAEDAVRPPGRARLDPAQHHPADRLVLRRRDDVGHPHQPAQQLADHPRHAERPRAGRRTPRDPGGHPVQHPGRRTSPHSTSTPPRSPAGWSTPPRRSPTPTGSPGRWWPSPWCRP